MEIKKTEFIKSSPDVRSCPVDKLPEFAFAGRSNVGKSSFINMLVGKKNIAKVSSFPGKTQYINHFKINDTWYLVDLPGYGYARRAQSFRKKVEEMLISYLKNRDTLQCLMILVDSTITPQKNDLDFINIAGAHHVPCVIVFTKTDRISESKCKTNTQEFMNRLLETWETLPRVFYASAVNKAAREEVLVFIDEVLATV